MRKDPHTGQTVADPNLTNKDGLSALSYALMNDHQEIVDRLCDVTTENLESYITLLAKNRKLELAKGSFQKK